MKKWNDCCEQLLEALKEDFKKYPFEKYTGLQVVQILKKWEER